MTPRTVNHGICASCGGVAQRNGIHWRRTCGACRVLRYRETCYKCGGVRDGSSQTYCRACLRQIPKWKPPPMSQREGHLRRNYGMTVQDEIAMKEAQGYRCGACGVDLRSLPPHLKNASQVDHSHATGQVRAILCCYCNPALAIAQEDPARLRALADYVERFK